MENIQIKNNIKEIQKNMLLKFLNRILTNLNRSNIEKLTDFINIDRDSISNQSKIYEEMQDELFSVFDRVACGWYQKNKIKNFILTFFKKSMVIVGLNIKIEKKEIKEIINGKRFRRNIVYYSII